MTPDYQTVLGRLRARFQQNAGDLVDWETEAFSSPIEKVFVATMIAGPWAPFRISAGDSDYENAARSLEAFGLSKVESSFEPEPCRRYLSSSRTAICVTQYEMTLRDRRIRPDFAFIYGGVDPAHARTATRVIVELDGHDFHERTPEQAQADKSRDRELQALGWHVLRFTGREVLREPERCLEEASALLYAKALLERQREIAEGK